MGCGDCELCKKLHKKNAENFMASTWLAGRRAIVKGGLDVIIVGNCEENEKVAVRRKVGNQDVLFWVEFSDIIMKEILPDQDYSPKESRYFSRQTLKAKEEM